MCVENSGAVYKAETIKYTGYPGTNMQQSYMDSLTKFHDYPLGMLRYVYKQQPCVLIPCKNKKKAVFFFHCSTTKPFQ